ncbi:MAG TPA: acyl-CoA dehydrogenase family protein [Acidisphaera sp.]|nr:acyl-CoA dehydrogenase family protein [Acidisphaera sp.]
MSDQLADSAERLFAAYVGKQVSRDADRGTWPQALWRAVEEAGFTAALLPEAAGGFGATPAEAFGLLRVAAAHAAPIPLPETMLAGWLLARAGLSVPGGVLTVAPVRRDERLELVREGSFWRVRGTATRVPWGRQAELVAVVAEGPDGTMLASVPASGFAVAQGANVAGEPRDTVTFDTVVDAVPCPLPRETVRAAGAGVRAAQIAGALSKVLEICVGYVQTRVQFGRPIGKFQAIQQNMAVLAGQSAAAIAAADMAARAFSRDLDPLVLAAAKARAGEAASIGAALAHQAHGAIGFTQEYALHDLTRRLWSWRDEFGNEAEWNLVLGRAALRAGGDGLWPAITA